MGPSASNNNVGGTTAESSVWVLINSFEKLLEGSPDDVHVLESLAVAYEEAGIPEKARQTGVRLARLLLGNGEVEHARQVLEDLMVRSPENAEVMDMLAEVDVALAEKEKQQRAVEAEAAAAENEERELETDLHAELDFAWLLLDGEQITQGQYEQAVNALTENHITNKGKDGLSFLQELRQVAGVNMDRVIAYISAETNSPYVDASRCQLDPELVGKLGIPWVRRYSALPFSRVGVEIMVAVLNPSNTDLRERLARRLGTRVHIFLTSPDGLNAAVDSLEK